MLSGGIVAAILWFAARLNLHGLLLDQPNARSLHAHPTPRYGGVAIAVAAVLLLYRLTLPPSLQGLLLSALFLAVVSLIDDRKPVPVAVRLAIHLGASGVAAYALAMWLSATDAAGMALPLDRIEIAAWGWCLAVIAIAWMTNLFNFMDGADGLAGGMTCIGFATYALAVTPTAGASAVSDISLVLAGAAAGFLLFNFPPAKVFLGDVGSIPIGFLAATIGLYGAAVGFWSCWFPPLLFSVFIVDATVTLARRFLRGEKIWEAHRDHIYQRLILSGWSHRKTAFSYYFLMLLSAISALISQNSQLRYPIVTFWVITYAVLLLIAERSLAKNKKVKPVEIRRAK